MQTDVQPLDALALRRYLDAYIPDLGPALELSPFSGGQSNLNHLDAILATVIHGRHRKPGRLAYLAKAVTLPA